MPKNEKMTQRQKNFCKEYARNGHNGLRAAIFAGYSSRSARQTANETLQKPYVKKYLKIICKSTSEKIQKQFNYTVLECFNNLVQIQRSAVKEKQYPAAIKAEELKAKLANLFTETFLNKDIVIRIKTSSEIRAEKEDENEL